MPILKYHISMIRVMTVIVILCPLLPAAAAWAQTGEEKSAAALSWDFEDEQERSFSLGKFVTDIFTPQIIIDTKHIRDYIRDDRFQKLRKLHGDTRAIDAIYVKSLKIAEYNVARALFLSFMAVLEHRKVDLKIPIVKSLAVPLTFEEDSIFNARLKNLPAHVYADTPPGAYGDIDKLQHFFGSAYLAYATESPGLTGTTGTLIEWGEEKLVVDGSDDPRDQRANNQGKDFGRDLLVVKTLLPSDYLAIVPQDRQGH